MESNLVLPNQLFEEGTLLDNGFSFFLVEEVLFFKQFNFHKQKLLFHRATMQFYRDYLQQQGKEVEYIESTSDFSDVRKLLPFLKSKGISKINMYEPSDDWLERRLAKVAASQNIEIVYHRSPQWLNSRESLGSFFRADKKKFFQTSFYKEQRKKWNILLDEHGEPEGGKWSFDDENRKRYPKGKIPPKLPQLKSNNYFEEAKTYVETNFHKNIGELSDLPIYPIDFEQSKMWLKDFLQTRFFDFGIYEDAIVINEDFLNHSILTPMLNSGLLTPRQVIQETLAFTKENEIPLNSTEGFIRQIIGWREFIRGVYLVKGREERTRNFWKFSRKIPSSFYDGTTGILPIDETIKKVLKTGYCHHIERLMILGNFMLLCEFDPDEVYKWFMELFIDSYDWVMVTNIYGMSQFADGGLMSTKPYISGSNYLMKMSDYPKGEWQQTWDGLFWNFIDNHESFFLSNPRLSMMVRTWKKMDGDKQSKHLNHAELFLNNLK